jgi:peptidoglycan-associated lipoprotein
MHWLLGKNRDCRSSPLRDASDDPAGSPESARSLWVVSTHWVETTRIATRFDARSTRFGRGTTDAQALSHTPLEVIMSSRSVFVAAVAVAVATLGLACGGAKPPESKTAEQAPQPTASAPTSAAGQGDAATVNISDEIRSKCGIPDADAYFDFDSRRLTQKDHTPLDLVVKCFTSGPLKGRTVKLVGRADPRGETDYNFTLGQGRADAVGKYLNARGLDRSKAQASSRGAMDATGTDEAGWQRDRRVDILVGN